MKQQHRVVGDVIRCKSRSNNFGNDYGRYLRFKGVIECAYMAVIKTHSRKMIWTFYQALLLVTLLIHPCSAHIWEAPGCHKVGHIREERIANCVVFNITLNVCRGFCESFAVPSPSRTLSMNPNHLITSRAECCNIRDTHDVKAVVKCFEETGEIVYRELIYKSAESCSCSICKK